MGARNQTLVLTDDQSSIPSTHTGAHNHPVGSRGSRAFFVVQRHTRRQSTHAHQEKLPKEVASGCPLLQCHIDGSLLSHSTAERMYPSTGPGTHPHAFQTEQTDPGKVNKRLEFVLLHSLFLPHCFVNLIKHPLLTRHDAKHLGSKELRCHFPSLEELSVHSGRDVYSSRAVGASGRRSWSCYLLL